MSEQPLMLKPGYWRTSGRGEAEVCGMDRRGYAHGMCDGMNFTWNNKGKVYSFEANKFDLVEFIRQLPDELATNPLAAECERLKSHLWHEANTILDMVRTNQQLEAELLVEKEHVRQACENLSKVRAELAACKAKEPTPPAFVVHKPGVYRRRDGKAIIVDHNTDSSFITMISNAPDPTINPVQFVMGGTW